MSLSINNMGCSPIQGCWRPSGRPDPGDVQRAPPEAAVEKRLGRHPGVPSVQQRRQPQSGGHQGRTGHDP